MIKNFVFYKRYKSKILKVILVKIVGCKKLLFMASFCENENFRLFEHFLSVKCKVNEFSDTF